MKTDIEHSTVGKPLLSDYPVEIKADFIRKVYSLISLQLVLTFTTVSIFSLETTINTLIVSHPDYNMIFSILSFLFFIMLFCFQQKYPANIILLFLFTLCTSYNIGYISAVYVYQNNSFTILCATGITFIDFFILTWYVLYTKKDFQFLHTFLFIGLLSFLLFSVFTIFSPQYFAPLNSLIGFAGSVLFSGFILYDTSILVHNLGPDDYIIAAVQLYLDIVNLFLSILQFLRTGDN